MLKFLKIMEPASKSTSTACSPIHPVRQLRTNTPQIKESVAFKEKTYIIGVCSRETRPARRHPLVAPPTQQSRRLSVYCAEEQKKRKQSFHVMAFRINRSIGPCTTHTHTRGPTRCTLCPRLQRVRLQRVRSNEIIVIFALFFVRVLVFLAPVGLSSRSQTDERVCIY